jgi:5-methyltetrahydropteroyltriglutamate--homocysteine methyltransferase
LDDVPLAMLCDPVVHERVRQSGLDPEDFVSAYVALFNDCLRDRPEGLRIAVHLCRGNYKGHFLSEGGYESIAEPLFNEIQADAFFLEYDSPRAGDFQPLRLVPAEKFVVLGLVSSKTPEMETMA